MAEKTGQSSPLTFSVPLVLCQSGGHARPASHVQPTRYPFHRHDAFPSQARCHLHFLRISLAPPLQVRLPPTPSSEFLRHNPLGLSLPCLLPFCPIVTLPHALGHLRQQFLAKSPVP